MFTARATPGNVGLANAVNSRIHSDAVMLSARASLWRFGGIGALIMLAGMGVGAAFYGYSYVNENQSFEKSADRIGSAIAAALEKTTLGVKGTVDMEPGKVALEPGGKVALEPGARVEMVPGVVTLKPGATVGEVVRPTERQWNGPTTPGSVPSVPSSKVVTNFTIFKTVEFGSGSVMTGWIYSSNEQQTPTHQFCYYQIETSTGISTRMNLAENGQLLDAVSGYTTIDGKAAAAQRVLFNGQPTR